MSALTGFSQKGESFANSLPRVGIMLYGCLQMVAAREHLFMLMSFWGKARPISGYGMSENHG